MGSGGGPGVGAGGGTGLGRGPGSGPGRGGEGGTGGWVMPDLLRYGVVRSQCLPLRVPTRAGSTRHAPDAMAPAAARSPSLGLDRTGTAVVVRTAASAIDAWASTMTSTSRTPSTAVATASR